MSTNMSSDYTATLHGARAQAARMAYAEGLRDAHRHPCSPQIRAHVVAIEAVGHMLALLPIGQHLAAFDRLRPVDI